MWQAQNAQSTRPSVLLRRQVAQSRGTLNSIAETIQAVCLDVKNRDRHDAAFIMEIG